MHKKHHYIVLQNVPLGDQPVKTLKNILKMQPSQELNSSGGLSSNHMNAAFALKQNILGL